MYIELWNLNVSESVIIIIIKNPLAFRFQSKFTENVGDKSKRMYKLSLFDINETQVHYTYNHWM